MTGFKIIWFLCFKQEYQHLTHAHPIEQIRSVMYFVLQRSLLHFDPYEQMLFLVFLVALVSLMSGFQNALFLHQLV